MEVLIGTAAGILVVFLCLFCYRQGLKDGRAVKDNKPLPQVMENVKARQAKEREEMAKRPPDPRAGWLGYNGDTE